MYRLGSYGICQLQLLGAVGNGRDAGIAATGSALRATTKLCEGHGGDVRANRPGSSGFVLLHHRNELCIAQTLLGWVDGANDMAAGFQFKTVAPFLRSSNF